MQPIQTQDDLDWTRLGWESMSVAGFTVDCLGTITSWNRRAEVLTGRSSPDAVGRSFADVFPGLKEKEASRDETEGPQEEGSLVEIISISGRPVFVFRQTHTLIDHEGEVVGRVENFLDVTQLNHQSGEIFRFKDIPSRTGEFPDFIGEHPLMREVFHRIDLAADSNVSVIITGESGTGKELAAEAIHRRSARSSGNFVKVNCSAIPETLLESELFGHVKGAFTGAQYDKVGRFQLADKGTIFLDEIGDISTLIQVKLLRVLQEKTFERVGESAPTTTDVRIVCATNRDLTTLVNKNLFREDLFYRINVFPVHIPALRSRPSDIPTLVQHFIAKIRKDTDKEITGITADALTLLRRYSWPGNVRQLENAIEHAFVTANNSTISIFDLPAQVRTGILSERSTPQDERISLKMEEKERILAALRQTNWNRTKASKLVGISRVTLWKRIKEFGLLEERE